MEMKNTLIALLLGGLVTAWFNADRRTHNMRKLYLCLFISFVALCALSRPSWATDGTLMITMSRQLTEPHNGNIIIGANNVVLDCAGFTVDGANAMMDVGILVVDRTGVTVQGYRLPWGWHILIVIRE